ncbi:TRAP transporter substrate-binding protein [Sporosarcina sp. FSL K6-3508]|uniref:TRAP transporter substrate-binding protein n=1 Tax=Sporosarcina sp. FSL K6-3508 TaxID=2921557 RepID=UPI00315ADCE8
MGDKKNRSIVFFLFTFLFFVLAGCGTEDVESKSAKAADKPIKLSYAFFAPDSTFPAIQMKEWAKELESRTDGKVKIDMFYGATLLEANNMFDGVANGTADIGLTATTYEPGRFPLLEISDLPSGYPNSEVASRVVNSLIQEYPPEALKDFKVITAFATEPSYIQSRVPISNLKEMTGKQLRISGGLTPVMERLGAAPVGMSQAEVPEALQTGVIEGNVSSREVLKDFKLAETVKFVTDYPFAITSFVSVMNKDTWESLPKDVQEVIDELNSEMGQFAGKYLDKHVEDSMKWSQEEQELKVIPLTDEESSKWDDLLREIQEKAVQSADDKGLPGSVYHERLYELIDEYSN